MQKKVFTLIFAVMMSLVFAFVFAGCGGKTDGGSGSSGGGGTTEQREYTVTFDSDGGSKVESITVKEGERVEKPVSPTKASLDKQYKFMGWFVGEKQWTFDTDVVEGDLTLKARWEIGEEFTKIYPPKS